MRHGFKTSPLLTALLTAVSGAALTVCVGAQEPYEQPDESWIVLGGTIVATAPEAFVLDYGEGTIRVEMDDWDWYDEAAALLEGDDVTVYGRIDDDLYETRTIEADSVYVEDRNTYFYANDADEEDFGYSVVAPIIVGQVEVTGTVAEVQGREFRLRTSGGEIQVDTSFMGYNPLDDLGYQHVQEGDRVRVLGAIDDDLFERRELIADAIVTLQKDAVKTSQNR